MHITLLRVCNAVVVSMDVRVFLLLSISLYSLRASTASKGGVDWGGEAVPAGRLARHAAPPPLGHLDRYSRNSAVL
ncbi:hypothetical protein DFH08DRAFT_964953 [Mycena albidolilacea]|uniref:Uncharacterized protein n=1 Tax=Mycena albidolilacea TaxID=1033008 RepID=A0AAD6ZTV1_9AGAR|nr:hypothetical protein DFH08DRAFT_964953 [Mycena albidolilacea]